MTTREIKTRFENYGRYSSDNYGVNSLMFRDENNNKYWFSYNTLVAFEIGGEFHIIENLWGTTTGKHLNWINNNKKIRESEAVFLANYNRLCSA